MSENVYGRWTKKFPRYQKIKARMRLESSQKIIVVSAILYNILRLWGEEDNEEGESDDTNVTVPNSLFEMK